MSSASLSAHSPASTDAGTLLRQVTLSHAGRLAREGSYSSAEALLAGLLAADVPDATALDLLARIRAQQGALLDAASLWRKVQQLDPNHAGAAAGLERLRAAHRKFLWLKPILVGLAVVICGGFVFSWQASRQVAVNTDLRQHLTELAKAEASTRRQQAQSLSAHVDALKASQAKAEESLAALQDFNGKLDSWAKAQEKQAQASSNQMQAYMREFSVAKADFERQLSALQVDGTKLAAQHEAATQSLSNHVAALHGAIYRERALVAEVEQRRVAAEKLQADYRALENRHETLAREIGIAIRPPHFVIDVPGVTTSVSGNEVIIEFDDGLFDHGTHFKLGAKERLYGVAKALSQSRDQMQIQVVGFADDERAFLKWTAQWESALALRRASAVVDQFIMLGLLQPRQFTAVCGDRQQRPFAGASAQSRPTNRTAVLRVSVDRQQRR